MQKRFSLIIFTLITLFAFTPQVSANNERYINSNETQTGTLLKGEKNVHIFTLAEDGDMYVYLSNTTAPIQFKILNPSNRSRVTNSTDSYFTKLKAGTYFIEVEPDYWDNHITSGSYELTAIYADGNQKRDQATLEPNDIRQYAYKLNSGEKISTSLHSKHDKDFFEFTHHMENADVYIYLSNTNAPVEFDIYSSDRVRIGSSRTTYANMLPSGTYYIEVKSKYWRDDYTSANYDLVTTFSTPTVKHNQTTFEPNDTKENAFPLVSSKGIKSSLTNGLDRDYYSFTPTKEGYVNIELSQTLAPVRFTLYDSGRSVLASNATSYSRLLKDETYYIEVHSYYWGNEHVKGVYALNVNFPNHVKFESEILLTLDSKTVRVNGINKQLLAAPYMKNARTLVPIRLISEQLGANVQWKASDQSIKILLDGSMIDLKIGSRFVSVNGKTKVLDIAPELKNGTTFVPIRFISEELGRSVEWNAKKKQVLIK